MLFSTALIKPVQVFFHRIGQLHIAQLVFQEAKFAEGSFTACTANGYSKQNACQLINVKGKLHVVHICEISFVKDVTFLADG